MAAPAHRSTRPGSRTPAALTLVLVALLCGGLLAMHHLSGGDHHAGSPMSSATSTATSTGAADPTGVAASAPDHDASGVAQACVTALLAGLLGLLVHAGAGWRARRTASGPTGATRTGGPRPGRGPPRDLLAQLCVLRT